MLVSACNENQLAKITDADREWALRMAKTLPDPGQP
jgi:hypothetical protein